MPSPATWDLPSFVDAVVAFCTAMPNMRVFKGTPAAADARSLCYVTSLPTQPEPGATGGVMRRRARIFVGFAYRTGGVTDTTAIATGETAVATAIDAFQVAFYSDLSRSFGGVVDDAVFEADETRAPLYQTLAGVEFRVVPFIVSGTQTRTFAL